MVWTLGESSLKKEFEERHKRIREHMRRNGIDILLLSGTRFNHHAWTNYLYVSNTRAGITPLAYVVFPLEGVPTQIVSPCQMEGFTSWDHSVISDIRWPNDARDSIKVVVQRIKELKLEKGTIAYTRLGRAEEEIDIPARDYNLLRYEFPEARLVDATDMMNHIRMVKSSAEVEELRKAATICDRAMEALVNTAREGATEDDLYNAVGKAARANRADHEMMVNMGSAPMIGSPVFAPRYARGRTLAKGDYIMNELGLGTPSGYEAQICRPITIGEPTKEFQRVWEVTKEVFDFIMNHTKPGVSTKELGDGCSKIVQKTGFYVRAPHMHGLGLNWERPVIWPEYTPSGASFPVKDVIIESNIVFVNHVFIGGQKSKVMVAIGDSIVVTKEGCEFLTQYQPRGIVVK